MLVGGSRGRLAATAAGQRRRPGSDGGVGGGAGHDDNCGKVGAGMVDAGASAGRRKVAAARVTGRRPGSNSSVGGAPRQRQRPRSCCRWGGRYHQRQPTAGKSKLRRGMATRQQGRGGSGSLAAAAGAGGCSGGGGGGGGGDWPDIECGRLAGAVVEVSSYHNQGGRGIAAALPAAAASPGQAKRRKWQGRQPGCR